MALKVRQELHLETCPILICNYSLCREDTAVSCEEIYSCSSNSVQLLCLYSKLENLAILVVYRQPDDRANGHPSTANDFINPLIQAKSAISALETVPNIIFGGDFNFPKSTWPDGLPKAGCPIDERLILNALNQFCNDFFMSQYVDIPTHKDGNILDLVFTNNDSIIHNCSTIPVLQSTSHHDIVMVLTCLNVNSITDKDDQPEPYTKFNTLNFYAENIDWVNIKKNLQKINWIEKLDSEDPNEILETINTICYKPVKMLFQKDHR